MVNRFKIFHYAHFALQYLKKIKIPLEGSIHFVLFEVSFLEFLLKVRRNWLCKCQSAAAIHFENAEI